MEAKNVNAQYDPDEEIRKRLEKLKATGIDDNMLLLSSTSQDECYDYYVLR